VTLVQSLVIVVVVVVVQGGRLSPSHWTHVGSKGDLGPKDWIKNRDKDGFGADFEWWFDRSSK
jgi:hypothetical protein